MWVVCVCACGISSSAIRRKRRKWQRAYTHRVSAVRIRFIAHYVDSYWAHISCFSHSDHLSGIASSLYCSFTSCVTRLGDDDSWLFGRRTANRRILPLRSLSLFLTRESWRVHFFSSVLRFMLLPLIVTTIFFVFCFLTCFRFLQRYYILPCSLAFFCSSCSAALFSHFIIFAACAYAFGDVLRRGMTVNRWTLIMILCLLQRIFHNIFRRLAFAFCYVSIFDVEGAIFCLPLFPFFSAD